MEEEGGRGEERRGGERRGGKKTSGQAGRPADRSSPESMDIESERGIQKKLMRWSCSPNSFSFPLSLSLFLVGSPPALDLPEQESDRLQARSERVHEREVAEAGQRFSGPAVRDVGRVLGRPTSRASASAGRCRTDGELEGSAVFQVHRRRRRCRRRPRRRLSSSDRGSAAATKRMQGVQERR